jgi:hypothetical protein
VRQRPKYIHIPKQSEKAAVPKRGGTRRCKVVGDDFKVHERDGGQPAVRVGHDETHLFAHEAQEAAEDRTREL